MAYSRPTYKPRYENFIGGEWVPPLSGEYFDNLSPVDGELLTKIPRSSTADVDAAVAAAKAAIDSPLLETSIQGARGVLFYAIAL